MQYLHIGPLVRAVVDDVARDWPAIEAEAVAEAATTGAPGVVYVRTDNGGTGAVPIRSDHPVTFSAEGRPTHPGIGVIIGAFKDLTQLHAQYPVEQQPEQSDEEIAEMVRGMKEERPHLDWDNLLMGRLAGPATPDRPDVPVWDYLAHAASHPKVPLTELTAVRFPVQYLDGPLSVTSVDEELKPPAKPPHGERPTPRWTETAETVIGRYAALHDAGVIAWDPELRGITHLKPIGSHLAVLHTYAATLLPKD